MVTIKDIANRLNLSPPTVSLALRNSSKVKEKTRQRILKLADDLGYVPDYVAAGLKTKQTRLLGVIVPSLTLSYWNEIVEAIEEQANGQHYSVLVGVSNGDIKLLDAIIHNMVLKRVDGIIFIAHSDVNGHTQIFNQLQNRKTIIISVDDFAQENIQHVKISFDNFGGAHEATRYLISLGHRRIVHMAGPHGLSDVARERKDGFVKAMQEQQLPVTDQTIIGDADDYCSFHFDRGIEVARTILSGPHPPTAIFAACDPLAQAVMRVAHEKGLRIPEDLSVVGFGDEHFCVHLTVPLTTVRIPCGKSGALAFDKFFDILAKGEMPMRVVLPLELIVRGSTAPPGT